MSSDTGGISYEQLGFQCPHAEAAALEGVHRLRVLASYGTDAQLRREWDTTDPLTRAWIFQGVNRSVSSFIKEAVMLRLVNRMLPGLQQFPIPDEEQLEQMVDGLERLYNELCESIPPRLQHLHDEEGNLVPWEYAPLPPNPADAAAHPPQFEAVPLSQTDQSVSSRLLSSIFGLGAEAGGEEHAP